MITDCSGAELTHDSSNVKIRLVRTFKLPLQTMSDINAEVKTLSPEDVEDFKRWYNEAGYPTT
jgi:hypothetical protein